MIIHDFFDNTLSVRNLARNTDISYKRGQEKPLYNVGQIVDGKGFGFLRGVITEMYEQDGYYYYIITFKHSTRARKTYTKTLRQKDITII